MLAFTAPHLARFRASPNALRPVRVCSQRNGRRLVACAGEMYSSDYRKRFAGEVCTYCENERIVVCPVCRGEGVIGRTILCRYCSGKKKMDCPLCSVDDIYQLSYGGSGEHVGEIERAAQARIEKAMETQNEDI